MMKVLCSVSISSPFRVTFSNGRTLKICKVLLQRKDGTNHCLHEGDNTEAYVVVAVVRAAAVAVCTPAE
jgi:hypothetical protein